MAAVLDALAPYVKKLIKDMAEEEVSMLLGVSGEITKLDGTMESLRAFVSDAERRRITDLSVQRWVNKLKDAMYDAIDIMELCQLERELELGEGGNRVQNLLACFQPLLVCLRNPIITCGGVEKMQGFFQRFLFCLGNPVFAHEIGNRIKELNQRLEGIYEEADNLFKFKISLGSSKPESMKLTAANELSSYKTISRVDESAIVGEQIERDTKELVQVLTTNDKNDDLKVVSIIGTGGMGKTTLAQKIFNDATIQEHFKTKTIWLSITQQFDEAELLRTAIKHAGGNHGGEKEKSTLTDTLIDTLSTKGRFLLVMDDLWSLEAWNDVLRVPVRIASKKQPGSRVLVTTRSADLPQQMQAILHQHRVRPLDDQDAWSLLKKQLQPDQVHDRTDHLKDIGMKIISKCGGLPLAIKVMGGLLSTKSRSEGDWEAVLNHHAWSVAGLPQKLDNAIYLSYEHLSPQLKQCFLYCSLFPKGTSIWKSVIVSMWISEGFIMHPPDRSSTSYDDQLEEIADGYYQELITRNLIEPTENSVTQYSCTMHDVVRSFAEFMSKEESLVVQEEQDAGGSRISQVRRLCIGSTKSALEWDIVQRTNSLRTLIINQKINVQPRASLRNLSMLRVLYISGTHCDRLVDSLCHLRHLRYLHLEYTNISRLPRDIHRMKFLQHIVVAGCPNLDHLPSCITQLLHLRSVSMYGSHVNVSIPKGFGQLTNLRTLYGFRVHLDMDGDRGWCSLDEIGPLSQLRKLTLHALENVPGSSSVGMSMISSKEHLDYLVLKWSSSGFMGLRDKINKQQQQRVVEEVIEKLSPPSSVRHLKIEGYFGSRLPNWMMVPSTRVFKSLRHLRMDKLHCCTQLPNGLCQLPSLESLSINDAPAIKSVRPEFQSDSCLAIGPGIDVTARSVVAFPNLTYLRLDGLREWEEWDWEEASESEPTEAMAMPALKELVIITCKLSCLPPGLASSRRHALRKLCLHKLSNLTDIENFPSVVELYVFECPKLKSISDLSKLQKIEISYSPNVDVLEGIPSLDSMEMEEPTMETLPEYMTTVSPRYFKLTCSKKLYESLLTGSSSSEYDKISHIKSCTIFYMG